MIEKEGKKKPNKEDEIERLNKELKEIKDLLCQLINNKNSTNKPANQTDHAIEIAKNPTSSTGNEGVPTDRQTIYQPIKSQSEHISELIKEYRTELLVKFKGLTKQEFKVFSAIYIFEQEGNKEVSYSILSKKLGLTESSIRDYVMRLERKGIPVEKTKVNNKLILLKIRPELRQIATLDSLTKLREIRFTE